MKLVGMLDSPYVRRVAISLHCLGVPFAHEAVSVFSGFEQFQAINPVVKAPSLVCDNGVVLMDSSLILQYVEAGMSGGKSLWSGEPVQLQQEMRVVSLALAACEKSIQIVYERNLRPAAAQYEPWMQRVQGQLLAACAALEQALPQLDLVPPAPCNQACITSAVVWQFTQSMLAELVPAAQHPVLVAHSTYMEQTPGFRKYPPLGPGV